MPKLFSPHATHRASPRTPDASTSASKILSETLKVFLFVLLWLIIVLFLGTIAAGSQSFPCSLNALDRTVTICSPYDAAVLDSPIHVVAGTRNSQSVKLMQIYLDGKKVFENAGDVIDTNLGMSVGAHRLTVQALDAIGFYRETIQIAVNSAFMPRFAFSSATDGTISSYTLHSYTGQPRPNGYAVSDGSAAGSLVSWGRFLYVTNGTSGTISAFAISRSGRLAEITGSPFRCGTDCRGLAIHPSGEFLYVADFGADLVRSFRIDASTGVLWDFTAAETGRQPSSLVVDPGGRYVYVTNSGDATVSGFDIVEGIGALTPMSEVAFTSGAIPTDIGIDQTARFVAVSNAGSNSISLYFVSATGALKEASGSPTATGYSPAAIAMYPSGAFVYVLHPAVNKVSSYKIDYATGAVTLTGTYNTGSTPTSLSVDAQGKFLYVSNSGVPADLWTFRINPTTGTLVVAYKNRTRGAGAALALSKGPTSVSYAPGFLYVGSASQESLTGSVAGFAIASGGALTGVSGSPFLHPTGATALAAHPSGRFLYAPGRERLSGRGFVVEYLVNSVTGALTTSQLLDEQEPLTTRSMAVDASGRFAYAPSSPDGEPALFGWAIDQASGALGSWLFYALGPRYEAVALDPTGKFAYFVEPPDTQVYTIDPHYGDWIASYSMTLRPFRNMAVDPSGQYAIGIDDTNNVVASYRIDSTTGKLTELSVKGSGTKPYAVAVDPYCRFVFVANNGSSDVSVYRLNGSTGTLTEVAGSPFPAGLNPVGIAVDDSGRYLYVANAGTGDISAYSVNGTGGTLTTLSSSPVATGAGESLTSIVAIGTIR